MIRRLILEPSPVKVDASGILFACAVKVGDVAPTPISKIIALPAQRGTPSFFSSPTLVDIGFSFNLRPRDFVGLGLDLPLAAIIS